MGYEVSGEHEIRENLIGGEFNGFQNEQIIKGMLYILYCEKLRIKRKHNLPTYLSFKIGKFFWEEELISGHI